MRKLLRYLQQSNNMQDEQPAVIIRRDLSGGVNTRQQAQTIGENQAPTMDNVDIIVPGELKKRQGDTDIADDLGANPLRTLHSYRRQGYSDYVLTNEGTTVQSWISGDATWTSRDTGLTSTTLSTFTNAKESGLTPDDIAIYSNGTDNVLRYHIDSGGTWTEQDLGDTNTSPPKTTVFAWYNNRIWGLLNDLLYYSDAYSTDYSTAFDRTTDAFRVPVGNEKALQPTRDLGLVCFGEQQVWSLVPSATPVATDQPQFLTEYGCVAGETVKVVGDDILWLSQDGVRALKRTIQDKLQVGQSFPLSFPLKDEYETISWAYIEKACAIYFNNRYILSLPVNSSTYNNQIWVYYPAYNSWSIWDGINAGSFAIHEVNGEEVLYYGDANDGQMRQLFSSNTDQGSAITMTFESREEDFGSPLVNKSGGWLEVEAKVSGSNTTLTVSAAINGGSFQDLGTMSLDNPNAPSLPINLPFTLAEDFVVRDKFHLERLGRFRTIQFKIVNSDSNTDPIVVYAINSTTYVEDLQNE